MSPAVRYLVFVDSDAQPRPEWLRSLLARLSASEAAVVTGYRWFMPCRRSLAQKIVYTINCTIMSLLGRSSHYLVWGGSWAIRRDTFDSLGLHAAWKGTLSDDLVAARVLREARCQVSFQPACVVASPLDFSAVEAIRFIRRQYLIGRQYADFWWLAAVVSARSAPPSGWARSSRSAAGWPAACRRPGSLPRWPPCCTRWGRIAPGSCRTWPPFTFPIAWTACKRFGVSPFGPPRWLRWPSGCCW